MVGIDLKMHYSLSLKSLPKHCTFYILMYLLAKEDEGAFLEKSFLTL